jgi:glycosyltransferase involved in cell wall biosynthesis
MKICIVAEGCYPYVVGGVSSWIHSMVKLYPNVEFILLTLIANRSQRGAFKYDLPENLTEVHEVYLDDLDWNAKRKNNRRLKLNRKEANALRSLVFNKDVDWDTLFTLFARKNVFINNLLMGPDFLKIAIEYYEAYYSNVTFSDYLWTLRSVYLPLFTVMKAQVPEADLYHCASTGYAGILGCMGQSFHRGKLLISEHGIYTREREEELIKADWIGNTYRNIWIQQFKKMSKAAYDRADMVTSLYEYARTLQIELGCPEEKTRITPNGISVERLENIPGKLEEDLPYVNIGAVLRVAPIKDVKTLIQAFAQAKELREDLKLWIMGSWEEEQEYAEECFQMVSAYGVKDVIFTDRVDVTQYLGRMDMTILTSISEGQPLTVLESYAVRKPVICTDVGCCRELIYGNNDGFGTAGILTHIMDVEEIAQAMLTLAASPGLRTEMGENGYRRVNAIYHIDGMKEKYLEIYQDFCKAVGKTWLDEDFKI